MKTCKGCSGKPKKNCYYCVSCSPGMAPPKKIWGETNYPRTLKRLIIEEVGHRCDTCLLSEWFNRPMPLDLEHVDGNSDNNERSNLQLICPNCHTFTPTYKGKNKGNGRYKRRLRYQEGKSY